MSLKIKVLLFIVISIILGAYFCSIVLKYPYLGIELFMQGEQYVIKDLDQKGIAHKSLLREGDIIVEVDSGSPYKNDLVTLYKVVEQVNSLKILRGSNIYEISFLNEITSTQAYDYLFIPSIFFLINLSICVFIYIKKKDMKCAEILCYLFIAMGLSTFSASASARGDVLGKIIVTFILVILPVLFLHFIYSYYFEKFKITLFRKRLIHFLYIAVVIIMILELVVNYFFEIHKLVNQIELSMFLITFLLIIYVLITRTIKYRDSQYSPPLKILNIGIILSFSPFVFLYLIPNLFFHKALLQAEGAAVFIIILPLSFIYLLMSKRLFDIDFVVSRLRYNLVLSIVIEIIIITFFIISFPNGHSPFDIFKFGFFLFFILNLFFYLLDFSSHQIRPALLMERNNYKDSLYRFLENMKGGAKLADVIKHIKVELSSVLGVKEVFFFQVHKKNEIVCTEESDHVEVFETVAKKINNSNIGSIMEINEGFIMVIGETTDCYLVLLSSGKSNMTVLNREEKEWLKALAFYASVSLENIRKVEDLIQELEGIRFNQKHQSNWLSRLIFSLSEKERKSISEDIHDTVLQEQIILSRKLESTISSCLKINNPKLYEDLNELREGLLDNIYVTREVCNELRPPFIKETGIITAIDELIRKYQLKSNLLIHFTHEIDYDINNEEILISIYRIIQELLNNTLKHSEADKVDLFLEHKDDNIQFLYRDNGKGFSFDELSNLDGHLGLKSIQERVHSLDGNILFISENIKGLEVQIKLNNNEVFS